MQQPQAKLKEISRILALWPSQAGDDGEELLRAYLLAAEDYPADDVTAATDTLVKGTAPGINPSFRPKPSEVGAECRRQMNLRLDRERREKLARPALPAPLIVHDAESVARVQELVRTAVEGLTRESLGDHAESARNRKAMFDRTNARFDRERFTAGDTERAGE